jgi:PAS domain S-box-containing protein
MPRYPSSAGEALLKAQNDVLELVARGSPLASSLDVLLRAIESLSPGMLSSILLLDGDGVHVRHGAAPSLPASYVQAIDGEPIGPRAGSCGTAAYLRRPVIVDDIATDPLWEKYRDIALSHGLRACWSTPIFDGRQRVLGTFALYFRTPTGPSDHHRELIALTTHTAAIAIGDARERQAAQRREAQLDDAQRVAQMGSFEWEAGSPTITCSKELRRIFGLEPNDPQTTFDAYLDRIHGEDREQVQTIVEHSLRERTPLDFEYRIVRPDGAIRHIRSQGRWRPNDAGEMVRLAGISQDITDRKLAEEQARISEQLRIRNEQLKAFAYMVSHDLKAPLRSVSGYAHELARQHRQQLNERAAHCVDEIVAGAQELDALIEDLLHYARLDAETPKTTDVDLAEIVESILRDRRALIRTHRAQVSIELGIERLHTWERGLAVALTNVIDNALKFSRDASPPRILVRSEPCASGVRITVADNGIGFDVRHRDRIFGLFQRLVSSEQFEGTGAGLAIVKRVVEKIGGRVSAESTAGAGATFVLDLPSLVTP